MEKTRQADEFEPSVGHGCLSLTVKNDCRRTAEIFVHKKDTPLIPLSTEYAPEYEHRWLNEEKVCRFRYDSRIFQHRRRKREIMLDARGLVCVGRLCDIDGSVSRGGPHFYIRHICEEAQCRHAHRRAKQMIHFLGTKSSLFVKEYFHVQQRFGSGLWEAVASLPSSAPTPLQPTRALTAQDSVSWPIVHTQSIGRPPRFLKVKCETAARILSASAE